SRVVLRSRVDDPKGMDHGELTARLDQFKRDLADKEKRREERDIPDELDDRRLWELIVNDVETFTPEEAVDIIYGPLATGEEKAEVRQALQSCQTQGVGYFERAQGRGEVWKPRTVDEVKAIRREIEHLNKLRNKLIKVTEEWHEELEIEITRIEGVPIEEADLDEDDHGRLDLIRRYMTDFVLHDTDRGVVGMAGTNTHTLDGFSMFKFCRFLAFDWLGDTKASISGAFLRFLVDAGLMDVREANDLVAKRYVHLSEHFSWEIPKDCTRAADRLPDGIPDAWREGREDLRAVETYTIDPPDAEDFDDAISIVDDGENTLLYVHIADVAQYVTPGSTLDHEAKKRGTSCYLPTGVLPMLPERISENLCSLRDDSERPAMTVRLTVDPDGKVIDEAFHESIIQVDENLSYDVVDQAIQQGEEPFASLHALAQRMKTQRRGLTLETDELKVHIDSDKVDPHLKSGSEATRLIEQFMVAANEAVARHLTEHEIPVPYRCHPLPDRAGVRLFNQRMQVMEQPFRIELPEPEEDEEAPADEANEDDFLEALKSGKVELMGGGGFATSAGGDDEEEEEEQEEDQDVSGAPKMKGLAQLSPEEREAWLAPFTEVLDELDEVEDDQLADIIQFKLLSCMGRAYYTPENVGHFGLGSTCYLHFTSPIRRYPDLITHRQLKWLLRHGPEADEQMPHSAADIGVLAPKNTDQGVDAERMERDLISVAMAFEARTDRMAGDHSAMVNGITKGSVFLSMERGVEARLSTQDVPGGPWSVDDADAMLFKGSLDDPTLGAEDLPGSDWREVVDPDTGEVVFTRLRLGDRVKVRIKDYDLVRGRIHTKLAAGEATDAPASASEEDPSGPDDQTPGP
ncbi:MAG: ribonuclease R, partial [Candidatus Thermoplasmatota archaeon]|nr:ribonuclease R [Candidatus Thermoplasmatota archaeon]